MHTFGTQLEQPSSSIEAAIDFQLRILRTTSMPKVVKTMFVASVGCMTCMEIANIVA